MSQQRQIRRIEKAIDELIKIQDDGKGTGEIMHILDTLRSEKIHMQIEDEEN